jgi:hypothetical protein
MVVVLGVHGESIHKRPLLDEFSSLVRPLEALASRMLKGRLNPQWALLRLRTWDHQYWKRNMRRGLHIHLAGLSARDGRERSSKRVMQFGIDYIPQDYRHI